MRGAIDLVEWLTEHVRQLYAEQEARRGGGPGRHLATEVGHTAKIIPFPGKWYPGGEEGC